MHKDGIPVCFILVPRSRKHPAERWHHENPENEKHSVMLDSKYKSHSEEKKLFKPEHGAGEQWQSKNQSRGSKHRPKANDIHWCRLPFDRRLQPNRLAEQCINWISDLAQSPRVHEQCCKRKRDCRGQHFAFPRRPPLRLE